MNLIQGLQELSLTVTDRQISQLEHYISLLLRWNQAYNLISRDTEQQIIPLHILDSVSVAQYLKGELIADVGTGAGLPGIPLAILHPDKQFYLVESNGKRTRFLTQCKIELKLDNIHIVKERAEEYHPATLFNTVLTRAFAQLADSARVTQHLLPVGGILLAMQGQAPTDTNLSLPAGISLLRTIPLHVPGLNASRHVTELEKKEQ